MAGGVVLRDEAWSRATAIIEEFFACVVADAALAGNHVVEGCAEHGRLQQTIEGRARHAGTRSEIARAGWRDEHERVNEFGLHVCDENAVGRAERAGDDVCRSACNFAYEVRDEFKVEVCGVRHISGLV